MIYDDFEQGRIQRGGSEPLPNNNGRSRAEGAEAPIPIFFRQ